MNLRPRIVVLLACAGLGFPLFACGNDREAAPPPDGMTVAVAFYPIEEIVRNVGGEYVEVVALTPPGGAPHDLELTAKRAETLEKARVVFYLGKGFQPAIEKAVAGLPEGVVKVDLLGAVDLLPVIPKLEGTSGEVDGEELADGRDPHVWLDPKNMVVLTEEVAETLAVVDPDHRDDYLRGSEGYRAKLTALDGKFGTTLANCASRSIVTSHRAFEYLARRYGLKQIAIAGISPDEEPDPRSLEAVAAAARADGVTVIFFEEQVSPKLSQTVAAEIGATTDTLDPVETVTAEDLERGRTYLSVQEANLAALARALRCS
ncbi:MAG: metal ABC transporter substrate-binding protein [Actinomycetota bacterium]|jgi:zinc transport system substrate-binding protein